MKYINADIILPEELLKEVQKYVQGGMVYIPKPEGLRKKWGENSGSRVYLKKETWKSGSCLRRVLRLTSFLLNFVYPAIPSKKLYIPKTSNAKSHWN